MVAEESIDHRGKDDSNVWVEFIDKERIVKVDKKLIEDLKAEVLPMLEERCHLCKFPRRQ